MKLIRQTQMEQDEEVIAYGLLLGDREDAARILGYIQRGIQEKRIDQELKSDAEIDRMLERLHRDRRLLEAAWDYLSETELRDTEDQVAREAQRRQNWIDSGAGTGEEYDALRAGDEQHDERPNP